MVLGDVAVRHPAARVRDVEQDVDGLAGADEHCVLPHEVRFDGVVAREVLEVDEPRRLVFTVTDRPHEEARELVIVELTDLGDGRTEMRFEQRGGGLAAEQYERAKQGWGTFFDRMDERLARDT